MSREDSRRRAARARDLRATGKTWQQVADSEGWRSRRSAQLAVARLAAAEPAENPAALRRTAADGLRITKSILFAGLAEAKRQGDHQAVMSYARAIADNIDKDAKLNGLHVPVAQQVDVNVTTDAVAIIDRRRAPTAGAERRTSTAAPFGDHRRRDCGGPVTETSSADVIKAAMSVARDAAEGRLDPTDLEQLAVAELRCLFGTVAGPGDALWDLQVEVARNVLAQKGIEPRELSEWLALARQQHTIADRDSDDA